MCGPIENSSGQPDRGPALMGRVETPAHAAAIRKIGETMSLLSDEDLYLFNEGSHIRLYRHLGAHPAIIDGKSGTNFAVWAPDAEKVFVMGDFNGWNKTQLAMHPRGDSGIWETFVPKVGQGAAYKYHVVWDPLESTCRHASLSIL